MANRKAQAAMRANPRWRPPSDVPENDGPVDMPDDIEYRDGAEVARWAFDQGASYRLFAWACAAVCDLIVRELDAARLLEDDRPEAIIASVRRWCRREAPDDALQEASAETVVAWQAAYDSGPPRYYTGLAAISDLLSDAYMRWRHKHAPYVDLSLRAGTEAAAAALSSDGHANEETRAMVLYTFAAAFSERMHERIDNPGRLGERVEPALPVPADIAEVRYTPWQGGFSVEAFAVGDPPERPSAYVEVRPFRRIAPACAADFERLRARLRLRSLGRLRLHESQVIYARRGEGLGVALYATALREAALRHGAALSPDDCDAGGVTSPDARRVWASRRLATVAESEGRTLYWRPSARVDNPARQPFVPAPARVDGLDRDGDVHRVAVDGWGEGDDPDRAATEDAGAVGMVGSVEGLASMLAGAGRKYRAFAKALRAAHEPGEVVGYLDRLVFPQDLRNQGRAGPVWAAFRDAMRFEGAHAIWTFHAPDHGSTDREARLLWAFVRVAGFRPVPGVAVAGHPVLRLDLGDDRTVTPPPARAPARVDNPRRAMRVYTPDEVIESIGGVEGMEDEDLHAQIRAFPRWHLVRWPASRFHPRRADEDMVQDYVEAGPAGAPPVIAVPTRSGPHALLDGAHRRAAADQAKVKLRAFVALDEAPQWVIDDAPFGAFPKGRQRRASNPPARPCDPGDPPRFIPTRHPRAGQIQQRLRWVQRTVGAAQHSALRAYLIAHGGPDLDLHPDADWDRFVGDWARLREAQTTAMIEAIRSRAEADGIELLGVGSARVVFPLGADQALKVSMGDDEQTPREAQTWKTADRELASLLCPVLAHGRGWLVMARADPNRQGEDGRGWRDFRAITRDFAEDNRGLYCGRTVLIDYGL